MNPVLRSILLLPGMALIVIPILLLFFNTMVFHQPLTIARILPLSISILLFLLGILLMGTTIRLFASQGHGTLAPWDPPKHLVIAGPYRYMRNPMILGVVLILLAETLLFWSLILFLWTLLFFLTNHVSLPFIEEKRLHKRFGTEYQQYVENVPRWIPRLTPWELNNLNEQKTRSH